MTYEQTRQRRALLDAIIANPADDLTWLIYADWCEEHGQQARAGFIRWSLAAPDQWRIGTDTVGLPYCGFIAPCQCEAYLRRGFVCGLKITQALFLQHAAELFAEQPIETVTLQDRKPMKLPNGRFQWLFPGSPHNPDWLRDWLRESPEWLDPRLSQMSPHKSCYVRHDSEKEAIAALSDWCVAYGRKAADAARELAD